MTVSIQVAPHPDLLIARVCDQLASPPEDPFAAELIAVPTRGIERWMTQQIATGLAARGVGDGICANIEFPSPSRLVREVLLAVPGLAGSVTAWEGEALTARVLDAIDTVITEPWMGMIRRHLDPGDGSVGETRLAAATKIARLFSTYARRRPQMIRAWASGADVGPSGQPIPDGDAWQPRLWRSVRDRIHLPSLPELLPDGLDPIRRGGITLDLPHRVSVYGLTAFDPFHLEVLTALGEPHDVHLYILHPSPALWTVTARHLGSAPPPGPIPRGDDPTVAAARHPMLVSWARESRELQYVLATHGLEATPLDPELPPADTVLTRLQADIRHNRPAGFDENLAAAVTAGRDRSVQIHLGHGARRQVEVARDTILHVLADDPTLEPRDVVIMTPDLETFGPLLEAAFPPGSAGTGDGLPDLRLRIADRAPAATNPLVRFTATVLDLADSRLEAGTVRELVTRPTVQRRFGFDTETAGAIIDLIDDARISWGLDAADRAAWNAGRNEERTWGRGLDRALTGVFYRDSPVRVVAGIAPLDGIEGQDAVPAGLLAAIMDRIVAIRELLAAPQPISVWGPVIARSVRLLAAPAGNDEWQLDQLERLLGETFPDPAPGSPDPVISLPEARRAITAWADDRPSPLHLRTGDITVCTLAPMRSVPYRVVCLVGMDDDRFPRTSRTDGDDLLLSAEIVGDFDRSASDRQLLIDAVMAAGDHLIVTYSARDELTNAVLPPAVPIAELGDILGDMVGDAAWARLETTHPLQSFSRANFTPGELGVPGAWGFDPMPLAGARAVSQGTTERSPAAPPWPDWEPTDTIELADLVAFLQHPARHFMRTRLGFTIPKPEEVPDDTLPTELSPLDRWSVVERLISGRAGGHDLERLVEHERAGDAFPPGALGGDDLADAIATATVLWDAAVDRGYNPQRMRPWRGVVPGGSAPVAGTVLADADRAHLVTVTPSRLKAKRRLQAFTELAFLSALEPEVAWSALLFGRRPSGDGHLAVTIGPIGATPTERREQAPVLLAALVDLYEEGRRAPLPLPCETAYGWQRNLASGRGKAFGVARSAWEGDRRTFDPEAADPAHVMLFPDLATTGALLDSGFEEYARRLWAPILALCTEKPI